MPSALTPTTVQWWLGPRIDDYAWKETFQSAVGVAVRLKWMVIWFVRPMWIVLLCVVYALKTLIGAHILSCSQELSRNCPSTSVQIGLILLDLFL
jgi:hypothetical protein